MGEADNQPSRLTDHPTLVRGRYTRVGGVSLPPNISQGVDSNFIHLYGYDWLGASARNTSIGIGLDYSQGPTWGFASPPGSHFEFYPGGAVIGWNSDRTLPRSATFISPEGMIRTIDDSCVSFRLFADTAGSDWPTDWCVTVFVVFFVRGMHGWIPFAAAYDSYRNTSDTYNLHYEIRTYLCGGCRVLAKLYIAYVESSSSGSCSASPPEDRFMKADAWFLYKELGDLSVSGSYFYSGKINKDDVGEPNARPTFYVGVNHALSRYSKYATHAVSRTFHVSKNVATIASKPSAGHQIKYSCTGACDGDDGFSVSTFHCVGGNRIYYSDPDYIGYSDAIDPQSIKLGDQIDAVVPSVRGIYAASTTAIYEAFGDFETLGGTGVSLVPIVAGVDDAAIANATFSGDVAYFVKGGEVYRLGPGGKEVMGVQVHRPGVGIHAINYDRYDDRLLVVTTDGEPLAFDATRKAWLTLHEPVPLGVPIVTRPRYQFRIDDRIYTESGTGHIRLEFEKLDFKLPGVRKRVHTIRVPYFGDLQLSAGIRAPGGPWRTGVTIQRDGYFEVRFPSVVSDSFDLYLDAFSPSNNIESAINPPIVITYEVREKLYAQE